MTDKKKILKAVGAATLCIIAVLSFVLYREYKSVYDYEEKSSIAMGTVVTQKLYGEKAKSHISYVSGIIDALEGLISYRKEDSAIYALNQKGSVTDSNIAKIISECNKVSADSEGKFDITVGEASQLWGIGTENERVPSKAEIQRAVKKSGYENIKIDGNTVTLDSDCKVDLGAVGKGAACDMIKSYLESTELKGAVVSVGGSILCYGSRNKAGDKWSVAVQHPRNEKELLGVIHLKEGFVSTSGDYERYFEKDGKRYHHILDAETGYPCDSGLVSVTVVCDNGLLSDALSTACFVLGKDKGMKLAEKYGASAVFVDESLECYTVGEIDFEG